MRRMRYHATQSLAALAIAAIPALAQAQAAAQPNPAAEHLAAARTALNKVLNSPVPAGDTFKKISDLKAEYLLLERAASTRSPEWLVHYGKIDGLIGDLLGASSSSKEAGAVGTSGRAGSTAGHLDAGVAANLQDFRKHLTAFSTAMSGVAPTAASVTAAQPAPDPPASVTAPPASVTAPSASVTAPSTSVAAVTASAAGAPAVDGDAIALLDQVTAMVDKALGTGAGATSETVTIDRATLEQIKKQLGEIKQGMKKP